MNRKIILWTSAVIITALAGFLHQRLGPYYPVSGTLYAGPQNVTFVLHKVHYGIEPFKILLRNDNPEIRGFVFWKKPGEQTWKKETLVNLGKYLSAEIKPLKSGEKVIYKGDLYFKDKTLNFPIKGYVTVVFKGKRPSSVLNVLYFFLFGGLLLGVRSALEYFNEQDKRRLFASLTAVFFFVASVIFYPFIKSYELDVINKSVPPITQLFEPVLLAIFIIWFSCALIVFITKNKISMLISGIMMIVLYQFTSFY